MKECKGKKYKLTTIYRLLVIYYSVLKNKNLAYTDNYINLEHISKFYASFVIKIRYQLAKRNKSSLCYFGNKELPVYHQNYR